MIKVLVTANAIYLAGGSLSGGDKRFIEIFKRIAAGGQFQVELMTAREGAEAAHREGMGNIAIHVLPSLAAQSPIGLAFDYAVRTLFALGFIAGPRSKYDLIYSTTDVLTDILPAFLLRRFGWPKPRWAAVVFHLIPSPSRRIGSSIGNWLSFWQQRACHALMKRADLIVADNSLVKQGLIARGLSGSKIVVAPAGGVDLARMESAEVSEEKFDAIFVGRLHQSKGIFDLPEIWAKVYERLPGLRLGIIGNGPADYPTMLAKAFADVGLSQNAKLLGSPTTEELYSLLKSSCIFVFPSYEEGWGIAACEAMALGLPVVAYNLPVYAEVFGGAVQTVSLGDRAAFADMIVEILSDASLRRSIVEQSIAQARRYTWESVARQEEEMLLEVMQGCPNRRERQDYMANVLEKLKWFLEIVKSVYDEHGMKFGVTLLIRLLEYFYYRTFFKGRYFQFDGKTYNYFYHLYNTTFRKERAVEIPIIMGYVEAEQGKVMLEVGNVLPNYFTFVHDVVDKYEIAPGVDNQDIVSFAPAKKYDLIVSISTLEHVGWDESPRENDKILRALENMRSLLNDGGQIVVTMPLGYNGDLDALLRKSNLPVTSVRFLRRVSADNQWQEANFDEVKDVQYGYPYQNANAIVIGIVEKQPLRQL